MKKNIIFNLGLVLLFSGLGPAAHTSPLQWKKYKSYKYDIKKLPEGKTAAKYISPDKHYELISRTEKSQNDRFRLYLHKKNIYTFIDDFQEIKKVEWEKDSSKVLFQGIKEIDNDQISYWK